MNDKGNSSTPPIYDHQPGVTRTHTQTHICGWVCARARVCVCGGDVLQAENYHSILHGEKKRCKVSDECRKDCNLVKGDTTKLGDAFLQGKRGRESRGGKGGGVLVMT